MKKLKKLYNELEQLELLKLFFDALAIVIASMTSLMIVSSIKFDILSCDDAEFAIFFGAVIAAMTTVPRNAIRVTKAQIEKAKFKLEMTKKEKS